MAEHVEEQSRSILGDVVENIKEKFDSSSSSDSDSEKVSEVVDAVKAKVFRIFGRERPVHHVLGGGCSADVILWRNKKTSGVLLAGVTAIWVLFELLEYFLITLVCHCLIVSLAALFIWSNASTFIHKAPPRIPEVSIPEDVTRDVALTVRFEINRALSVLRDIALGRDIKKFLVVIAGLWVVSIVGSSCNFLTLFYIVFILLHSVPVLYEKYEDKVDPLAEKAWIEIKKQYVVFDEKVLSKALAKIPKGVLKDKKH